MDTGEPCRNPMLIKRVHKLEKQRDALLEALEMLKKTYHLLDEDAMKVEVAIAAARKE